MKRCTQANGLFTRSGSVLSTVVTALLIVGVLSAPRAQAAISPGERQTLVDLYNSTGGSGWTTRTNWNGTAGTECAWYGVTCDMYSYYVQGLSLPANHLTGTLPASINGLWYLTTLRLQSNAIGGAIPPSLAGFMYLTTLDIRWNALYSNDASLTSYLNTKQPGWNLTQTIAPTGVTASATSTTSITVSWTPIAYTTDSGNYEVFRSTSPGGPFSSAGTTANKSASSLLVSGLSPGTTYYFYVRTKTLPHANNTNTVISENSPVVSRATLCNYTPIPTGASIGAGGATGQTFQVQPGPSCSWAATAGVSWITVTGGSPGSANGTVTYTVAPNSGPARSGTISIDTYFTRNGETAVPPSPTAAGTFTVTQASGCTYALNPTSMSIGTGGGSNLTFQVQTGTGCPWTATSGASWILITAGASGTGTGTVTYRVLSNSGPARSATITAAGQTFTVNQDGTCTYTLNPASSSIAAPGASGQTFQVQTGSNCFWTAVSNSTWVTVTGGVSGTGPGTVIYSVAANSGTARSGTITAAGQTFTVSQAGSCAYSLNPSSASIASSGASGQTFQVQTGTSCFWTAVSNASWVTVTGGNSGTSTGTVTYSVAANSGSARSGTITAGGQTFTVNQTGCPTITLSPGTLPAGTTSQTYAQTLSATGGAPPYTFTASGLPSWLNLNSATGALTGTPAQVGTSTFIVTAKDSNNCSGSREYSVTVNQDPCPPITISPSSLVSGRVDQPYSAKITASGGTPSYQYTSVDLPTWLALDRVSGDLTGTPPGSGTFDFTVEAQDAHGCYGTRAYHLFVEGCAKPATPEITSVPGGAVPAGTPFTVAWTPVLAAGSGGHYDVEVASNQNCENPTTLTAQEPVITLPTVAGISTVYCITVTATDGTGCRGNTSRPETVTVQRPKPGFALIGQVPTTQAQLQDSPAEPPQAILRNIGATEDSLTLSGLAGFFEPVPSFVPAVAPGADTVVRLEFLAGATSATGIRSGRLGVIWDEGRLAAPVTLNVLDSPPGGAEGVKLSYVRSDELHFRHTGEGNPAAQEVEIVNTGDSAARLAFRIGPGGAWLSVAGDFTTPLEAKSSRKFALTVDRSQRTASDGAPPLVTNLVFLNVDGRPEDAAYGQVFDEEPPPVESGMNRPPLPAESFSLIIGSVVSSEGIGARFVSDAWIRNRGATNAEVTIYFTPNGTDGLVDPGVLKSTFTILPFTTYRLSDLVKGIFKLDEISGAVEIRSPNLPQLSVRSTADAITTQATGIARYGSEIPIVLSGQGARKGSSGAKTPAAAASWMGVLTALRDPASGFRTNVILAETSGKSAVIRIRLYTRDGALVGQKRVELWPYSKKQVNSSDPDLFPPGEKFDGGSAEIVPESGEGAVAAFATIIDNLSGSYATRRAEAFQLTDTTNGKRAVAPRAVTGPEFLPAVTRSEALNNSFYSTRLALTNLARVEARLQLTYIPDKGQGEAVVKDVVVPARAEGPRAVVYDDVLGDLFGVLTNSSGMVRFDTRSGIASVASETSTPIDLSDPQKGRSLSAVNPAPGKEETAEYGVFSMDAIEVVGTPESGTSRAVVTLPVVEEGFAYRTNLILAELAGEPAEVKVRVVKPGTDGVSLGDKNYTLEAFQRLQRNKVVREVLGLAGDDPRAEFKDIELQVEAVSGKGRVLAIVTKIDNNPASKRADIFTMGGAIGGSPVSFGD